MRLNKILLNKKKIVRVFVLTELVLLSATVFSVYVIQQFNLVRIKLSLSTLISRIKNDLRYEKGRWDIAFYNSDPLTPNPSGSSGYTNPLYVITSDGFVIERNNPINGYLDSSDYLHLLAFEEPQYINTSTNEIWRVISKPINDGDETIGIITVSQYDPPPTDIIQVDRKLLENVNSISSRIQIVNGEINVDKVDIRHVHYNVSFEIVSKFNKVLLNNGRTPSFIDRSYFKNETEKAGVHKISDLYNGNNYLVLTNVINDNQNKPIAMIAAAYPTDTINQTVRDYIVVSFTVSVAVSFIFLVIIISIFGSEIELANIILKEKNSIMENIKVISFNKKTSSIQLDGKIITIPYASNQYYLVSSLFSYNRRWEQDQLLEKMGINPDRLNVRKIYDAALAVNRRVGIKLIIRKNKTYYLNKQLPISYKKD